MPLPLILNLDRRILIDQDLGQVFPITNMYHLGEETDDPEIATAFVAGKDAVWYSLALSDFVRATTQ